MSALFFPATVSTVLLGLTVVLLQLRDCLDMFFLLQGSHPSPPGIQQAERSFPLNPGSTREVISKICSCEFVGSCILL